jgi:hypothetical protein
MVREPLVATVPKPLMVAWVAPVVVQASVADWPAVMSAGATVMRAVGAGAAAGGGGGAAATVFLWHPLTMRTVARQNATGSREGLKWFTVNLLWRKRR